jgi:hypothetical protein
MGRIKRDQFWTENAACHTPGHRLALIAQDCELPFNMKNAAEWLAASEALQTV